jgi:toxin ParE1/3/4
MVQVNWTRDAIEDIDGIAAFIARDSPRSAILIVDRFLECADLLSAHPRRGKRVRELGVDPVRELRVSSYRLIYLIVNETQVDVMAIHHQKQLLPRPLLKRRLRRR